MVERECWRVVMVGWGRVVVGGRWRADGPERPTMADVRLDWGPGRRGRVAVAGEEGGFVDEERGLVDEVVWEVGSDGMVLGVVVLAVVSSL
jgi:hypothetical protein